MSTIKNIVLDYGHGGLDRNGNYTTAPSKMYRFANGTVAYEGVINRRIGGLLEIFLQSLGLNVVTTVAANDPRDLTLSYRVRVANSLPSNKTLFISLHSNASPSHNARGFELYTYHGNSSADQLATDIAEEVKILYDRLSLRLRFDFSDGDPDKEADFYVLRKTRCPAVLLECLFFDEAEDFALLMDPKFQKELAYAVFLGVKGYIDRS